MRSIKYTLLACIAAGLCGCSTTYRDREAVGTAPGDYGYEYGHYGYYDRSRGNGIMEGLNRGVNTNYFGPVNAGAEAALGPGTASGGSIERVQP